MNATVRLAGKLVGYMVCCYCILFVVVHVDDGAGRSKRSAEPGGPQLANKRTDCVPRTQQKPRTQEGTHYPNQLYYEYLVSKEPEAFIASGPKINPATKLIIMVLSKNTDYDARNEVRESWGSSSSIPVLKNQSATVIFLTGDNVEDIGCLQNEQENHGDLLIVKALDSYRGLVYKLLLAFRYLSAKYPDANVMKIDLDCILDIPGIMTLIGKQKDPDFIYGYLYYGAPPVRDSKHQWYVPEYAFNGTWYPYYVNGNVYLMSAKSLAQLLTAVPDTPVIEIEDLFFTGILREKVKGAIAHMPGYWFGVPDLKKCPGLPGQGGRNIIVHGGAGNNIAKRYKDFMSWRSWDCVPEVETKAPTTIATNNTVNATQSTGNSTAKKSS